jgi:hypothetical protein
MSIISQSHGEKVAAGKSLLKFRAPGTYTSHYHCTSRPVDFSLTEEALRTNLAADCSIISRPDYYFDALGFAPSRVTCSSQHITHQTTHVRTYTPEPR